MEKQTCHDCSIKEGELHKVGCDMEICPFCLGQLLSCDCCYLELGFVIDSNKTFDGLTKDIYENGLTEYLHKKWLKILNKKGREPYFVKPQICVRCGKLYDLPPMISDKEWEKLIGITYKKEDILCSECMNFVKKLRMEKNDK